MNHEAVLRVIRGVTWLHGSGATPPVSSFMLGIRLAREFPDVAEDILLAMATSPEMSGDALGFITQVERWIATGHSGNWQLDYVLEHMQPQREDGTGG